MLHFAFRTCLSVSNDIAVFTDGSISDGGFGFGSVFLNLHRCWRLSKTAAILMQNCMVFKKFLRKFCYLTMDLLFVIQMVFYSSLTLFMCWCLKCRSGCFK